MAEIRCASSATRVFVFLKILRFVELRQSMKPLWYVRYQKKSECWPEGICSKADILRRLGVEVWNVPVQDDGVDLWELTIRLGQRGIDSILLEG